MQILSVGVLRETLRYRLVLRWSFLFPLDSINRSSFMPTLPPPGQVRCIPVIVPGADARSAADWWVKVVYPVDHYPADPPGGERVVTSLPR